jgi:hypothetical protein
MSKPQYLKHPSAGRTSSGVAILGLVVLGLIISCHAQDVRADEGSRRPTFCNPMDLPYRFQLKQPIRREAADPTMAVYKNEYWLFPSKSGGYWHSPDCLHWTYVSSTTLPIETYAPTVEIVDGRMLWTAYNCKGIWANDDPAKDNWKKVSDVKIPGDPDLFLSQDKRLYLYGGCSNKRPITGVELDIHTLQPMGKPVDCIASDIANRGWENLRGPHPWIEGAWMTEHKGTFYLQYAAPGTDVDNYGDGVFTSSNALGPFVYAPYSPFSFKPTGFARGAGHSSTFQDLAGNYWHIATATISVRHEFERRLSLFPAGFTSDGQLYCNTYLGDYPQYPPGTIVDPKNPTPDWMLLSYKKKAEASSTLDPKHAVENAFDENMHHWWSAQTGNKGEWLKVDLGKPCRIEAIQTNFMDQDAQAIGMLQGDAYQYVIEVSNDGATWTPCIDKSQNTIDAPHDYVQLPAPVTARYVRLTNVHCPAGSKLSISGFRVFGNGLGSPPDAVGDVKGIRSSTDPRQATVSWAPVKNANFYIVRYGIAPNKLFSNYQIYSGNEMTLNALNVGVSYWLTVDAMNDSGVTRGPAAVAMR